MPRRPVLNKADMYARLDAGEFGNTCPQWFDIDKWLGSKLFHRFPLWGVRHAKIAGFPGTKLDATRTDVARLVREVFCFRDYQISPMVHQAGTCVFEGEAFRSGTGLVVCGNMYPANGTWRTHMKKPRQWERTAAVLLLRHLLNDNSHDDVNALLDEYPDHVVEFTALDTCFGTLENRNGVIWEVRLY